MIFIYAIVVSMVIMMRFCSAFFGDFVRFLRSRKRARELVSGEEESSDGVRKRCWIGTSGSGPKRCRVGGESNERNQERLLGMALRDAGSYEIDEDLHSRQLAVYGRDTMLRLSASNVLVSGMQGLGAEIAKNLVLAGVKSVTLHDEGKLELWDLSSNFLADESDIGQNRALASSRKLQELSTAVAVQTLTTQLTKQKLSDFQAVVFTDISLQKAIEFNGYCRSHEPPIAFIKTEVRGLFGSLFCDFGPEFTVFDVDGEAPHTGIVSSISNENPALVSCVDERLEFQDGDFVVFSEVRGMVELNDGKPRKIKRAGRYSFTLEEDTRKFRAHEGGGIVTQVKQPKVLKFKSLVEALHDPGEFLLSDFSKFDRPPLLHLAFQALDKFASDSDRFPVAGSEEDARKLILIARGINGSLGDKGLKDVNEKILRHFAFGAKALLNPMAAVFGGIAAQEVLKACSGKFHPLFQFFYFDSLESLPVMEPHPMDYRPRNDRYDAQLSVLGSRLTRRMETATTFIVGSGALGCELLKNIALMGVSCGEKGKSIVTDDDVIEKSNLSRQFLFRDSNIGQFKSTVAASAAAKINHRLNVKAMQNRVCAETEHVFVDDFWEDVGVVLNALDNVEARLYVDQKCLYFQKPLLESGTLGAKCNTQVVIPHLTENYGAMRDPPEKEAPLCTLRSFPYNIDHCLAWAQSEFDDWLETTPREVNAYLSRPDEYVTRARSEADQQSRERLERVLKCIGRERCKTVEDCIAWARFMFEDYFANQVKQLTDTFPVDAVVSNGSPFWSAPKRFPRPVEFSASDPSHVCLVMAASILRAETFGISIPDWVRNPSMLADFVDKLTVQALKAKQGRIKIETEDQIRDDKMATDEDLQIINDLISKIERYRASLPPGFKMRPIHFEKDDDNNHHVDLIAGLANMRARNYGIPEVDKLTAKLIAGRIIPAIATSTAVAAGLVCLELYKVLDGRHGVEDYRNAFANLALPLFSMAEPVRARVTEHGGERWSVWDRWVYVGDPTLGELLTWLKTAKGLDDVYSVSCGSSIIYNAVDPRQRERWGTKLRDLIHGLGLEIPPHRRRFDLEVGCVDEDDREIEVPLISVYFR